MQPYQMGQVKGPVLVLVSSLSTGGEVALRHVANVRMSQDGSGRKGAEQPLLLWNWNPFSPECSRGAQVPLHPLPGDLDPSLLSALQPRSDTSWSPPLTRREKG